jgi:hydrogenase nickel incorporation protein HypB
MVQNALNGRDLHRLDSVCEENAGNLVCPSSYDFGEDLRFVLLSATEGQDQPLTYRTIFNSEAVPIITKSDLADAVECDEVAARRNIQTVRPGMELFRLSAKTGEGLKEFLESLENRRTRSRAAAVYK